MTSAEKEQYKFMWDRFQRRYERIYTTKFKAALSEQIQQYKNTRQITSVPIYEVLVDLYKTVGILWSHKTQVNIKRKQAQTKSRQPMGFNERIIALMRAYFGIDLFNDAELITTYTREVIADVVSVLSESLPLGSSINEIVRKLEVHPELGSMRARRIARTEVVTSSNGAAIINAKELKLPMNKIWLAIEDKRTRHSHRAVDNVTVGIDTPFDVGGAQMMQPGVRTQTNGLPTPAKEIINCRCTISFEVIK